MKKAFLNFSCLCSYSLVHVYFSLSSHCQPRFLFVFCVEKQRSLAGLASDCRSRAAGYVFCSCLDWSHPTPARSRPVSCFLAGSWAQGCENWARAREWAGNTAARGRWGTSHSPFVVCLVSFYFINSLLWITPNIHKSRQIVWWTPVDHHPAPRPTILPAQPHTPATSPFYYFKAKPRYHILSSINTSFCILKKDTFF